MSSDQPYVQDAIDKREIDGPLVSAAEIRRALEA